MSRHRLPPPPPACLDSPYPSSQKGGTLIAEDIEALAVHDRRLCDPDGYRPEHCPRCRHDRLHVHDYPERVMRADGERSWIRIVRYVCAACAAVWRILPLFLARRLWRSWPVVERAALPVPEPPPSRQPPVPARTSRRWSARLLAAALLLTQALATSGQEALRAMVQAAGLGCARRGLVEAHAAELDSSLGRRLAELAALVHRLVPGLRLM